MERGSLGVLTLTRTITISYHIPPLNSNNLDFILRIRHPCIWNLAPTQRTIHPHTLFSSLPPNNNQHPLPFCKITTYPRKQQEKCYQSPPPSEKKLKPPCRARNLQVPPLPDLC
jgi:hypothetical protein